MINIIVDSHTERGIALCEPRDFIGPWSATTQSYVERMPQAVPPFGTKLVRIIISVAGWLLAIGVCGGVACWFSLLLSSIIIRPW